MISKSQRNALHNARKDGAAPSFRAFLSLFLTSVLLPLSLMTLSPASLHGMTASDSLATLLPELEVKAPVLNPLRKGEDGTVSVRQKDALSFIRLFGEPDMVARLKGLAGVGNSSDYSSGISVDGAEPSQTQFLIDGAPVIFPYRFGGIFSAFNTPHFRTMRFSRSGEASALPRLGGTVDFEPAFRLKSGIEGDLNIGLLSSSVSLRAGWHERVSLSLSARVSYVDRLYGHWLNGTHHALASSFSDFNGSLLWKINQENSLTANLFRSSDNTGYDDFNYSMYTGLKWHNDLASLSWRRNGRLRLRATGYFSGFGNRLELTMPQFSLLAPTSIKSSGLTVAAGKEPGQKWCVKWECGLRLDYDHIHPQWASLQMTLLSESPLIRSSLLRPQNLLSMTPFSSWRASLIESRLDIGVSVAASMFVSSSATEGEYRHADISPRVSLRWHTGFGEAELLLSRRCQAIHRVGFSELGLSSDFFLAPFRAAPPETALKAAMEWRSPLLPGELRLTADGYVSRVENQAEYRGTVMEVVDTEYNPMSHLIISSGYNYGLSLQLLREAGALTGGLSYSWSEGRRRLPGSHDSWRSLYSAGHNLKAEAQWHLSSHWDFSGRFQFASGRPYTPVQALYAIGGNIAMQYGERNSARLPYYLRLDLGASYILKQRVKGRSLRQIFSIGLVNATGRRNTEMQYFILNSTDGSYHLKRLYSLYRFLPYISYTLSL